MPATHTKHYTSKLCSYSECSYKVNKTRPLKDLIGNGIRIDKLFDKYLPLRERKLLEKLVRKQAAYDDIQNRILSGSNTDVHNESMIEKKYNIIKNDASDIHKIVNSVDRGELPLRSPLNLHSECFTCCLCNSKIHILKDPRVLMHPSLEDIESHEGKMHSKKRSVPSKANNLDPYVCKLKFSDNILRQSKEYHFVERKLEKIKLKFKEFHFKTKKLKMIKTELKASKLNSYESDMGNKKLRNNQSLEKIKKTESKVKESIRSNVTTIENAVVRIKNKFLSMYRKKLRKKQASACECELNYCIPSVCVLKECYRKIKKREINRKRNKEVRKKDMQNAQIQFPHSVHKAKVKHSYSQYSLNPKKIENVICECKPQTKSTTSMTTLSIHKTVSETGSYILMEKQKHAKCKESDSSKPLAYPRACQLLVRVPGQCNPDDCAGILLKNSLASHKLKNCFYHSLPYACEAEFCIPDECDLLRCHERIMARTVPCTNNNITKKVNLKSKSLTKFPPSRIRTRIPKYRNKHLKPEQKEVTFAAKSNSSPTRQILQKRSNININIEFYTEKEINGKGISIETHTNHTETQKIHRIRKFKQSIATITEKECLSDKDNDGITKLFLKRCFCTLKLDKTYKQKQNVDKTSVSRMHYTPVDEIGGIKAIRKIKSSQTATADNLQKPYPKHRTNLFPYELEPCFCMHMKTMPNKKVFREVNNISTSRGPTTTVAPKSSVYPSRKVLKRTRKRNKSKDEPLESPYSYKSTTSPSAQHRQPVRFGSNVRWNIEFYKDVAIPDEKYQERTLKIAKPALQNNEKQKHELKLRQRVVREDTPPRIRERMSKIRTQVKSKLTVTEPRLRKSFWTLKLHKNPRQKPKGTLTSGLAEKSDSIYWERRTLFTQTKKPSEKNQRVKISSLFPYECEPYFCIPGECDPFICDQIIKTRNRSKHSHVDCKCRTLSTQTKKQKSFLSGCFCTSKLKKLKIKQKSVEEGITLKNVSKKGAGEDIPFTVEKPFVKRCFCSLKLHTMPKQIPKKTLTSGLEEKKDIECYCRTVTNNRFKNKSLERTYTVKSKSSPNMLHRHVDFKCRTLSTQTKKPSKKVQTLKKMPSLMPYECEPYFCIPGECDPYICDQGVKIRNKSKSRPLGKVHPDKSISAPNVPGKQPCKVGSKVSLSIEFYNEVGYPGNKNQEITYERREPTLRQIEKMEQKRKVRHRSIGEDSPRTHDRKSHIMKTKPNVSKQFLGCFCTPNFRKSKIKQKNVEDSRPFKKVSIKSVGEDIPFTVKKPFLKRCFCTLKLHEFPKQTPKKTLTSGLDEKKDFECHCRTVTTQTKKSPGIQFTVKPTVTTMKNFKEKHGKNRPKHLPSVFKSAYYDLNERQDSLNTHTKRVNTQVPRKRSVSSGTPRYTKAQKLESLYRAPMTDGKGNKIKRNKKEVLMPLPLSSKSRPYVKLGSRVNLSIEFYKKPVEHTEKITDNRTRHNATVKIDKTLKDEKVDSNRTVQVDDLTKKGYNDPNKRQDGLNLHTKYANTEHPRKRSISSGTPRYTKAQKSQSTYRTTMKDGNGNKMKRKKEVLSPLPLPSKSRPYVKLGSKVNLSIQFHKESDDYKEETTDQRTRHNATVKNDKTLKAAKGDHNHFVQIDNLTTKSYYDRIERHDRLNMSNKRANTEHPRTRSVSSGTPRYTKAQKSQSSYKVLMKDGNGSEMKRKKKVLSPLPLASQSRPYIKFGSRVNISIDFFKESVQHIEEITGKRTGNNTTVKIDKTLKAAKGDHNRIVQVDNLTKKAVNMESELEKLHEKEKQRNVYQQQHHREERKARAHQVYYLNNTPATTFLNGFKPLSPDK